MWLDDFLAYCRQKGLSGETLRCYEANLERLHRRCGVDLSCCSAEELTAGLRQVGSLERSTLRLRSIIIRMALKWLGRSELLKCVPLPKLEDRASKVQGKVLSREEVERLIAGAADIQDRLLIHLLYETGARIGEVYNLKVKDVQFDEHGAILWLNGKSGARRRRVYSCVPDLRRQVNDHPSLRDPEARLFHYGRRGSSDFNRFTLYLRVRALGKEILKKHIHPHMFRHTRATEDSRFFTDREMMQLFGWKRSDMVTVYSHLSMRDVEDKDLVLHGLKPKEEILRPLTQIQRCPDCSQENAPIAVYCVKCGGVLSGLQAAHADAVIKEAVERIKKLEQRLAQLAPVERS